MHVLVLGFVNNMHELMGAADVIISKAGPGTISEALICGLPLVLNAYVPCQEEGNIPYVIHNHVGVFECDPRAIAETIRRWFGEGKEEFRQMAERARALGQPESLHKIVSDLHTLVAP
jgi:1,2-diacylglycerol 3-beta-galactosyltransferase